MTFESNGPLYAFGGEHPNALSNPLEGLIDRAERVLEHGDTDDLISLAQHLADLRGSDALTGFATGNRKGKPKKREQEILTPQPIADFVRLVFGGQIALDPCEPAAGCLVDAEQGYTGSPNGKSGLVEPWMDRTYVNPPFGKLKNWLAKAVLQASYANLGDLKRIIVLTPVRPHRAWYRAARDEARRTGFVVELGPVKFVGYDQAFPAPLALFGFNIHLTEDQRAAALKLGGLA